MRKSVKYNIGIGIVCKLLDWCTITRKLVIYGKHILNSFIKILFKQIN